MMNINNYHFHNDILQILQAIQATYMVDSKSNIYKPIAEINFVLNYYNQYQLDDPMNNHVLHIRVYLIYLIQYNCTNWDSNNTSYYANSPMSDLSKACSRKP